MVCQSGYFEPELKESKSLLICMQDDHVPNQKGEAIKHGMRNMEWKMKEVEFYEQMGSCIDVAPDPETFLGWYPVAEETYSDHI